MSGVSDLEIFQRLAAIAEELDAMRRREPTFVGGAALETASRTLHGMAMAIYQHSISAVDEAPGVQ
jgi:hypothetical protein